MQTGYHADFGPFDGKVWLNCAHQGPLPHVAADEAREAVTWKLSLPEAALAAKGHRRGVLLRCLEWRWSVLHCLLDDRCG